MQFEWDEKKRRINLRKHGIDFGEAYEIFRNPLLSKIDKQYYGEERWIGLGMMHQCVVLVVYVEHDVETIRIISIRKAIKERGEPMENISQTDWEKVNRLSDEDIDFSDIPETTEDFWQDAEWYMLPKKDSLVSALRRYQLKSTDIKMIVRLVQRLAA